MLRATKIKINRAEGRVHECGEHTFTGPACWEMAELHLMVAARTAPRAGGYNKCDIEIRFEGDGEPVDYATRYYLKHPDTGEFRTLAYHVRLAWGFYSGRSLPSDMPRDRWEAFMRTVNADPAEWAQLLDTCHVPTPGGAVL